MIPYIIKDNFLEERCFIIVEKELSLLIPQLQRKYYLDTEAWRVNLDDKYSNDRNMSSILNLFKGKLYSKDMLDFISSHDDLAYKLYNMGHSYFTCVTQIREERDYRWHTDIEAGANQWNGKFMAWIWYYNDDFEGGVLEVNIDGKIEKIKPKQNRLVLLPAYRLHSVTKPIYKEGSNYRTTINGFMSVK